MANRTWVDKSYSFIKGEIRVYCSVTAGEAATGTLLKWNYPSMAPASATARTYTAALTTGGSSAFPLQSAQGSEGVFSITRTAVGLWTVRFQDAYQRLIGLYGYISVAGGAPNVVGIHENTTITNMNLIPTTGAPAQTVIGVSFLSATATLVDPTAFSRVNLVFTLQNSTAP